MLGLSFCPDSRAVPRVHDWDPQPWSTQKVSVCAQQPWGQGKGQGRVWYPMGHRSLGVTLVKVGTLQRGVEGSVLLGLCLEMCLDTRAVSRHQGGAQVPE